ncbi:MAG: hypothetical protein AAFR59_02625, partial [Bacteroidota bacterium]
MLKYTQHAHQTPPRLYPIPTPAHNREVALYFPGQMPSDSDFTKVMIMQYEFNPNSSYPSLIESLKKSAQEAGVDGMLMQGDPNIEIYDTLNPELWIMPKGQISFLGIRYLTHMGHLLSQPYQASLLKWDTATAQADTILIERFDFYGNLIEQLDWKVPFGSFYKNLRHHLHFGHISMFLLHLLNHR